MTRTQPVTPCATLRQLDWTADLPICRFYHAFGILPISTVMDGDCGLDVMTRMAGRPQTLEARTQLRLELSEYLMARVDEQWMMDLMAILQEVEKEDVELITSGHSHIGAAPTAPAAAVPEHVHQSATVEDPVD